MRIEQSDIDYCKAIPMLTILSFWGVKVDPTKGKQNFKCPIHGADKKPSATYHKSTNKVHCYTCGKTWDTIEIWADYYGYDRKFEFRKIIEELLIFAGKLNMVEKIKENEKYIRDNKENINKQEADNEKYENSYTLKNAYTVEEWKKKKKNSNWTDLENYLDKRKIEYKKLKPILDANNIELKLNFYTEKMLKVPGFENPNKDYPGTNINSAIVDFKDYKFAIKRVAEDYLNPDKFEAVKKYVDDNDIKFAFKKNIGSPKPVLIKSKDTFDTLYFCEGIYDAFTLLAYSNNTNGIAVICLNSVDNINKLIETEDDNIIEAVLQAKKIVLACDNDKAGKQANIIIRGWVNDIRSFEIVEAPVENFNFMVKGKEYKDVNDFWDKFTKEFKIKWQMHNK